MPSAQIKQQVDTLAHWTDIFFQSSTGYINVAPLQGFGKWYGTNDISSIINDTKGKSDRYLSINSFGRDTNIGRPRRTKENLKQLRTIAIDIDQYTKGMSIEQVEDVLHALVLDNKIPEPNLVLKSRGVQIFYKIAGGASPSMQWLTHFITCAFIEYLADVGADTKASDTTRLMRVPDSINSRNNALVQWEIWNNTAYPLDELRKYTDVDKYRPTKTKEQKRAQVITIEQIKASSTLFYRVNHARIRDLEKLYDLRSGVFTHTRNEFVYILAYHYSMIFNTEHLVLKSVNDYGAYLSTDDGETFTEKEVKRTVKSAFKDARTFLEKYKADGYKITYSTNDGVIKPMKNETVIKKLNINEDEQRELNYLYGEQFKKEKAAEKKRKQRGSKGDINEYNDRRKQDQLKQAERIQELKAEGKTHKEVAATLNISVSTVKRAIKK